MHSNKWSRFGIPSRRSRQGPDRRRQRQAGKPPRAGLVYVYFLHLEDDCFYVGQTYAVRRRLEEHCTGRGVSWTTDHPPTRLLRVIASSVYNRYEAALTFWVADQFGLDRVHWQSIKSYPLAETIGMLQASPRPLNLSDRTHLLLLQSCLLQALQTSGSCVQLVEQYLYNDDHHQYWQRQANIVRRREIRVRVAQNAAERLLLDGVRLSSRASPGPAHGDCVYHGAESVCWCHHIWRDPLLTALSVADGYLMFRPYRRRWKQGIEHMTWMGVASVLVRNSLPTAVASCVLEYAFAAQHHPEYCKQNCGLGWQKGHTTSYPLSELYPRESFPALWRTQCSATETNIVAYI